MSGIEGAQQFRRKISYRNAKGELVTVVRRYQVLPEEEGGGNKMVGQKVETVMASEPAISLGLPALSTAPVKRGPGRPKGSRNKKRGNVQSRRK